MLILASASPRRRELLTQAGYSFAVRPASIVEARLAYEDGISMATRLAREKAESVSQAVLGSVSRSGWESVSESLPAHSAGDPLLVLGADTVVICDRELLGKPVDAQDAARMLTLLSGRTHQVVTGVALVVTGGGLAAAGGGPASGSATRVEVAAELTHVTLQTLSAREISRYVATGEPMDKAGSYAIQGYAGRWIPRINGCYFNVVGLPLALVAGLLERARRRVKPYSA